MVRVGLVTSVIIRVGSVTSTCLRSSFGDMRNLSAPMLPLSSGTLPGQIATTNDKNTMAADTVRCMVEFLRYEVINSYGFAIQLTVRQAGRAAGQQSRHADGQQPGDYEPI